MVHSVLWGFHDTLPLVMADDSYLRNTIVSASVKDTLQARREDTLHARQDDTLSARQDDTLHAPQDDTLSARQDDTLLSRREDTLLSRREDTLLSRREDTLHARQLDTPHTCHAHVDYNGRRDHNIAMTQSETCSRGHSDPETRGDPRELTPYALQDYTNSIACLDDSLTNTQDMLEDFTSSGHPHGNPYDTYSNVTTDDIHAVVNSDDMHTTVNPDDTTYKVQLDIEHFKEQYLHSLAQSTPRRPHASLPGTFLRRDSLPCTSSCSSEDISCASPSSAPDGEAPPGPVPVDLESPPTSSPGSAPAAHLLTRRHSCVGVRAETGDFSGVSPSVAEGGAERERFKEAYLSSLCLTQRSPRPRGLPVLKTRISQFEMLTRSPPPRVPLAGQGAVGVDTSGSGADIGDRGLIQESHNKGQPSVNKRVNDVTLITSDRSDRGDSDHVMQDSGSVDNVIQDSISVDCLENLTPKVRGYRAKNKNLPDLIVKNKIMENVDSSSSPGVLYPQVSSSPSEVYPQASSSPQGSSCPATPSPCCFANPADSSVRRNAPGYKPPVPPKPKLPAWLKKKLFAKVEAQHFTHNEQEASMTRRVKPGLRQPPISHPGHVLRRSLSAPVHDQSLHFSPSAHTPLVDFESTGTCVTPRDTDPHSGADDVDTSACGTLPGSLMEQPLSSSENPTRFRVKDFRVPSSAISKAYTEEEKAFILESLRQSGSRRVRSQSLESSAVMGEPGADTVVKPARPTPSKLSQSFTNIIKLFEPSEVKVQKGSVTSPRVRPHDESPDKFLDVQVDSPGQGPCGDVYTGTGVLRRVETEHVSQSQNGYRGDASRETICKQSETFADTSISDQGTSITDGVLIGNNMRNLYLPVCSEKKNQTDSLDNSACDRRSNNVEQGEVFSTILSKNTRTTSELGTLETFPGAASTISAKVGGPQVCTSDQLSKETTPNEAVSAGDMIAHRTSDPERVVFTERSEDFLLTQTPAGIGRQMCRTVSTHRSLLEDRVSYSPSQPHDCVSYCRSVEKFAALLAKALLAESLEVVVNILKKRRKTHLPPLTTNWIDGYNFTMKNVVLCQSGSTIREMNDLKSGPESPTLSCDVLSARCPGITDDLWACPAGGREGQFNDVGGVSEGRLVDHGDVSDNDLMDKPSRIESGSFAVRKSYSDISGSVESFYSGYSESLDSFQSADDVLLEQSRELCGTTSRNEGLAEDSGQQIEIEIPSMVGETCLGMKVEREREHNLDDSSSQELLGVKITDDVTGSNKMMDIWTSPSVTGSNTMMDSWTYPDVLGEIIARDSEHDNLGESDATGCLVARDLDGQSPTETDQERCPLATLEFEDRSDELHVELRCRKSPEENSSGFVSDVSEISDVTSESLVMAMRCDNEMSDSDVTSESLVMARRCDHEMSDSDEVKASDDRVLLDAERLKRSDPSVSDAEDVSHLDRNRKSGTLNVSAVDGAVGQETVGQETVGQETVGEAEDEVVFVSTTKFRDTNEVGLLITSPVSEVNDEESNSISGMRDLGDGDIRQRNGKNAGSDKCDNVGMTKPLEPMTEDDVTVDDDATEPDQVAGPEDVHEDRGSTDTQGAVRTKGDDPTDRRHGGSDGVVRWAQPMEEVYEEYDNVDGDESSCAYVAGQQGQQWGDVEPRDPLYSFEPEYQLLETIFERDEDETSSGECVCGVDSASRGGGQCPKCHVSIKVYDENSHEISSNDVDYTLSTSESSDSDLGVASRMHSKAKYESDGSCESMDIDSLEDEDSDGYKVDIERPRIEQCVEERQTMERAKSSSTSPLPIQPPSDHCYQQETQNESPPLSSHSFMLDDAPEVDSFHNSRYENINSSTSPGRRSMTLSQGQPREETQKSKVREKLWKEAEDVGAPPPGLRSPQRSQPAFHLDLASVDMTQMSSSGDDLLESPSSSLHRISSASTFQHSEGDSGRLHDPYRMLERSQSDASLIRRDNELLADADEVHLTAAESSSGQNISECNRVYLDLSRAEAFERVELGESSGSMMRTSSGRLLETIPQDEELKTGDLSYVYASRRSFSQESSSSMEDLSYSSKCKSKDVSKMKTKSLTTTTTTATAGDSCSLSSKSNLRSSFQIYSQSLKQKVRQLQMGSIPEQLNALTELNVLMEQAWSMPIYGKDLAYELCDILRTDSALDIIVNNLASSNRELMKVSARLLEQSLTTSNRRQISENGLELVVKMTHDARGDCELAQTCTGILESLFKTSEDTCAKVIKLGGLDTITYWCRCNDRVTLKNCAIALSNLALYGGGENQQEMAKHKVPEWLFPLAFVEDDSVRYYALLAIGVLVSNKEIENAVMSSGTLSLVLPFIDSHDPAEFAQRDMSHRHGRSPGWLKRLIPVLSSKREEAQALAAFHFVMEAGIKSEQGRKEVLYKIGAVEPLKWLASTPNRVASRLAAQALKIIGEEVPHKLSQQVPLWTCDDVVHWIGQGGFNAYTEKFQLCQVDGDLLLRLTEEELRDSLDMTCAISRKRFLRELRDLKISSDYTSCDPSMLGAWLRDVGEDMSQYTYQMLYTGVDRPLLRSIKDTHLAQDCNIVNGIHRMKILAKIEELRSSVSSPTSAAYDSVDALSSVSQHKPPIDVFISYRRSNGSQLASLLKVHLQLRGFTVFIDIERLRAGKFDESLLESVKQAKNFIIVLTPNALDRCMGDTEKKDWVHREITAAIESGSNIIPLLDNFKWPTPDTLPEDMRNVCFFNAVRWIHDYQDACVDKLEQFLRGETNTQQRPPVASNSSAASSTSLPRQGNSGFESPNSPPYQRAQGLSKAGSIESPGDT